MINITRVLLLVYQLSCFWSLQEAPHSIVEEATGKKMACRQITVLKTLTLEQNRKMSTALTAAAAAAEVENLFLGLSWVQEPALTCSARCWEDDLWCKSSRDWRHFEDCSSSAGSELKGTSSSLSPSTAQSLWRSVHSLRLRWPVLRNPDHTPAVITAVIRAVINPAPHPALPHVRTNRRIGFW